MALFAPDTAERPSTVRVHADLYQGTPEWAAARCGMLTASEMRLIITPGTLKDGKLKPETLKPASNEKERSHLYELLAQRVTGYVEPHFVSDDMLRGQEDEVEALALYAKHHAPTEHVGFITNDRWGFTLGYSPDALVGSDGLVECKSRRQKYQVQTFLDYAADGTIPAEYAIQIQTGLLVSERRWCDLVSYSGGLPLAVMRVEADPAVQEKIIAAARGFEERLRDAMDRYRAAIVGAVPTKRIDREMV